MGKRLAKYIVVPMCITVLNDSVLLVWHTFKVDTLIYKFIAEEIRWIFKKIYHIEVNAKFSKKIFRIRS